MNLGKNIFPTFYPSPNISEDFKSRLINLQFCSAVETIGQDND